MKKSILLILSFGILVLATFVFIVSEKASLTTSGSSGNQDEFKNMTNDLEIDDHYDFTLLRTTETSISIARSSDWLNFCDVIVLGTVLSYKGVISDNEQLYTSFRIKTEVSMNVLNIFKGNEWINGQEPIVFYRQGGIVSLFDFLQIADQVDAQKGNMTNFSVSEQKEKKVLVQEQNDIIPKSDSTYLVCLTKPNEFSSNFEQHYGHDGFREVDLANEHIMDYNGAEKMSWIDFKNWESVFVGAENK